MPETNIDHSHILQLVWSFCAEIKLWGIYYVIPYYIIQSYIAHDTYDKPISIRPKLPQR